MLSKLCNILFASLSAYDNQTKDNINERTIHKHTQKKGQVDVLRPLTALTNNVFIISVTQLPLPHPSPIHLICFPSLHSKRICSSELKMARSQLLLVAKKHET